MSGLSRLAELKAARRNSGDEADAVVVEIQGLKNSDESEYMKQFERVKVTLGKIEKNTERILQLKSRADVEVKDSDQKGEEICV